MKFTFDFTLDHLKSIINNTDLDVWYDELLDILPKYNINTPERVAGFLAQTGHESGDFKRLEENLNYSESALNRVFSRYFKEVDAAEYAYQPEKIANYVYMDEYRSSRSKLGNIYPGDGWKFRGRGLKQLTGRSNYTRFADSVDMTPEEAADYLETKHGAVHSACWFWDKANCNSYADNLDILGMTKVINGGTIGLNDREERFKYALSLFKANKKTDNGPNYLKKKPKSDFQISRMKTLRLGSKGDEVKLLQHMLKEVFMFKVEIDGVFGKGTERALKLWQGENSLAPDGVAGPITLRKMYR